MGAQHPSVTVAGILQWSLLTGGVYTVLSPQPCRLILFPSRIDSSYLAGGGLIVCPYLEC